MRPHRPDIKLRGIQAIRCKPKSALVAEAEQADNPGTRGALAGFAGTSRADGADTPFVKYQSASPVGTGFYSLMARKLGLYSSMDVARGLGETEICLRISSAWS